MNKQDAFCEHGIHVNIICIQCAAKRKADNEKKDSWKKPRLKCIKKQVRLIGKE